MHHQMRPLWIVLTIAFLLPLPALGQSGTATFNHERQVHRARWDRPEGFELGLRSGYGLPVGGAFGSRVAGAPVGIVTEVKDLIRAQVPIWIDLGYRLRNGLYLGVYGEVGPGVQSGCTPPNCHLFNLRAGFNARYHFRAGRRVEPWMGLGLGYELLFIQVTPPIDSPGTFVTTGALHGFEFLNAQVGIDFRVTRQAVLAPFFSCAVSQYQRLDNRFDGGPVFSTSNFDKPIHAWLLFGLRGAYNFGS